MNLKELILNANDLPQESVEIPEWGVTVHVRTMTARERDAFEAEVQGGSLENIRARLVGRTMVDDAGERIFGDGEIEALGSKSAKALDRLFPVAMKLNGLSEGDVEELEKN